MHWWFLNIIRIIFLFNGYKRCASEVIATFNALETTQFCSASFTMALYASLSIPVIEPDIDRCIAVITNPSSVSVANVSSESA